MFLLTRACGLLHTFLYVLVLRLRGGIHITEHIVALLGEGDLVDGVLDVAVLQHEAGIALCMATVNESLHVGEEPFNSIGSLGRGGGGGGVT